MLRVAEKIVISGIERVSSELYVNFEAIDAKLILTNHSQAVISTRDASNAPSLEVVTSSPPWTTYNTFTTLPMATACLATPLSIRACQLLGLPAAI